MDAVTRARSLNRENVPPSRKATARQVNRRKIEPLITLIETDAKQRKIIRDPRLLGCATD
jgi:hypothetical protein